MTTQGHSRAVAAVCVTAALLSQIAVPALHALVHALEAAVQRAHAARWRVEGAKAHEQAPEHDHGSGPHRHDHPGDRPGEHGTSAPEHLTLAILEPPAPAIPVAPVGFETAAPTGLRSVVYASAPVRRHGIRGPPSRS